MRYHFLARPIPAGMLSVLALLASAPIPGVATQSFAADCNSSPDTAVDWTGCRKRNLMLDGSTLDRAALVEVDFTSTDLRNSQLTRADFSKATLVRSMIDGSKAAGSNFEKAVGFRTSFAGTDLSGANFVKSEMQRAEFTGANLLGIDFEKSELGRAVFAKANINGTNFKYANLARADFREAIFDTPIDFTGAYFYRTRFEGVDLGRATGISQWQVDLACGSAETKLPAGLKAPASWPCDEE